ncbi:MAG: hypothetical protein P8Y72_17870, partial [Anaerolineales bacterium]
PACFQLLWLLFAFTSSFPGRREIFTREVGSILQAKHRSTKARNLAVVAVHDQKYGSFFIFTRLPLNP